MQVRKLQHLIKEEIGSLFHLRLHWINQLPRLLPAGSAGRIRSSIYRSLGVRVGANTLILGPLTLGFQSSPRNLSFGGGCYINSHVYIDAAAPVQVGNLVSLGHHVIIITSDHCIGPPLFRAGDVSLRPVTLEDSCWVAAGAVILPGVTVGEGAVVAAGAVVTRDVAPHTLVGGVPARLIRALDAPPVPGEMEIGGRPVLPNAR